MSETATYDSGHGRVYYARRLTYALLKELKATRIVIPDCAVPIFIKRAPKERPDLPQDLLHAHGGGKQFSWEMNKQLYVLPEHRIIGDNDETGWPSMGAVTKALAQHEAHHRAMWMAYDAGQVSRRTVANHFFGDESVVLTPADRTAVLPTELQRGLLPGAIVLIEDRSGCGRCPFALSCVRRAMLRPGPNRRFYFALCPRCHCLTITDTDNCTRYICGVMREERMPLSIEKTVSNGEGREGLLTPGQCCIERWMSVKEWARVDRNDCPKHRFDVHHRDGMHWISAYDCLEHYRMLASKHNITIEDQEGLRERDEFQAEEAAWHHARATLP